MGNNLDVFFGIPLRCEDCHTIRSAVLPFWGCCSCFVAAVFEIQDRFMTKLRVLGTEGI